MVALAIERSSDSLLPVSESHGDKSNSGAKDASVVGHGAVANLNGYTRDRRSKTLFRYC